MKMLNEALATSFHDRFELPALILGEKTFTYGELWETASILADSFVSRLPPGPICVLGARETSMYLGILAAVIARRAYVPLNSKFPCGRLAEMVKVSGAAAIFCDSEHEKLVEDVLQSAGLKQQEKKTVSGSLIRDRISLVSINPSDRQIEYSQDNEAFAYILFTSGSTGRPKGIGISQENLLAYLAHATHTFGVGPGDRSSQMFDLTFDLSVHDLFVTWLGGGCLCVPIGNEIVAPARFVVKHRLTHWFSVPSVASLLSRLRLLRDEVFSDLKQSLFCGEALPSNLAAEWQAAAPNSKVWNLYGPTEATIAISAFELTTLNDAGSENTVVPIGEIFPGHRYQIVTDFSPVQSGECGELWLSGPQVARGYLGDLEKSLAAFVQFPGTTDGQVWYRTGDLVKQNFSGTLLYLGRLDSQIQLHGHRIELGEVESALRTVSRGAVCVAIARPSSTGNPDGIVGFVEGVGSSEDSRKLSEELTKILPFYMIPAKIQFVPMMPLNSNGKTDRNALASLLQ
jgi:amino acid adenylation domain-containing protein